jgi:hypothetical protein
MAYQLRDGLFRPVAHTFGPDAPVPTIEIGPLSNRETERALQVMQAFVSSPKAAVQQAEEAKAQQEQLEAQKAAAKAPAADPAGHAETAADGEGARSGSLAATVNFAHEIVQRTRAGENPRRVLSDLG